MNHQLFENWLLSEEPLSPAQSGELREHLRSCQTCSRLQASWKGVEQMIREAPQVSPAAGFAARWQMRLAEQRRLQQRRQAAIMLSFSGGLAFLLFLVLSFYFVDLLRFPGQLLTLWVYRLLIWLSYAQEAGSFLTSFGQAFLNVLSGPAWLFVFGGSSVLFVLWIVLYKQLTSPQRIQL
jgi:hypothetical protein